MEQRSIQTLKRDVALVGMNAVVYFRDRTMTQVNLSFPSPNDLRDRLYVNGRLGGVTIDGEPTRELGEEVRLFISFERPAREFVVHGRIAWVRRKASKNLGFSYGVDFVDAQGELALRLVAFAKNEVAEYAMRNQRRVVLEAKVTVQLGEVVRVERLVDLSLGGAFIRTETPMPQDSVVELKVRFPGALLSTRIKARVAWTRSSTPEPGMGLEFIDEDGQLRARLLKLLSKHGVS